LPDKAIDVMDEAAAKVRLASVSLPEDLQKMRRELESLRREQASMAKSGDKDKINKFNNKIKDAETLLKERAAKWKAEQGTNTPAVHAKDIAGIIADWTGINADRIETAESSKLLNMEEELHKSVIGQDYAVTAIAEAIRRSRAGVSDPNRPTGVFLFAGPTGVGKTQLAKTLAEFLFGTQDKMIRIDMSEYMEKFNVSRLIGAAPGYVGYEEGGQLTELVRRNPYSVILLDEIEKAHSDVFNILLQIMDEGRLTDSQGRTVNFRNSVIIMTTNVGSERQSKMIGFVADKEKGIISYEKLKEKLHDDLKNIFRPEFLNRIDEIIMFQQLNKKEILEIVDMLLGKLAQQLLVQQKIKMTFSDKLKNHLVEIGYDPNYGARPLKRAIQKNVENLISKEIIAGNIKPDSLVLIDLDKTKNVVIKPAKEPAVKG
jgi:ATP-dependent Clp protease ATP-binding subunit ClpC